MKGGMEGWAGVSFPDMFSLPSLGYGTEPAPDPAPARVRVLPAPLEAATKAVADAEARVVELTEMLEKADEICITVQEVRGGHGSQKLIDANKRAAHAKMFQKHGGNIVNGVLKHPSPKRSKNQVFLSVVGCNGKQ